LELSGHSQALSARS